MATPDAPPYEADVITNDNGDFGVPIDGPTAGEITQATAVRDIATYIGAEVPDEEDLRRLGSQGRPTILREHTADPEDGCGCEEAGWSCAQGDGPEQWWLWFDELDIELFTDGEA